MPKKLDYSAAWSDAIALLRVHREAVVAVAGFFLFATGWAAGFLIPEPDMAGADTLERIGTVLQRFFEENWLYILPLTLIQSYGSFAIYVLLSGQKLPTIGDALIVALWRFSPYFIASIILGWLTILGFAAFVVPGLYLAARFALLPAGMSANPQLGMVGGVRESWEVTAGVGWKTFVLLFIVALITWLVSWAANMIIGLICLIAAGPGGVPLVQSFFDALFSTAGGLILIAVITATYRQLKPQRVSQ